MLWLLILIVKLVSKFEWKEVAHVAPNKEPEWLQWISEGSLRHDPLDQQYVLI